MDPALQRRIQRYGWDRSAHHYEQLWRKPLAEVRESMLSLAALRPGEQVLDLACGTGMVAITASRLVGPTGRVLGVDLSGRMVDEARAHADAQGCPNIRFERADAEALGGPDHQFDVAFCAFGLMYVVDPGRVLSELRRVLRPGGRIVLSVWGERMHCGWAGIFPIVDAEVRSEVCPLFFHLGEGATLPQLCRAEGFAAVTVSRHLDALRFDDDDQACDAMTVGGPVALAWSRFDEQVRRRVRRSYLAGIAQWRTSAGFEIPAEFVVVGATTLPLPG